MFLIGGEKKVYFNNPGKGGKRKGKDPSDEREKEQISPQPLSIGPAGACRERKGGKKSRALPPVVT